MLRVPVTKIFVAVSASLTYTFPWTYKLAPCALVVPIPTLVVTTNLLIFVVLRVPLIKMFVVVRELLA